MLDLDELTSEYEIVHPKAELDERYKDVKFYTIALNGRQSMNSVEKAKDKKGRIDGKFIEDTFVKMVRRWEGIAKGGVEQECNEANKRAFVSDPRSYKLAQYVMDKTDELARDEHGVDEGN